MADSPVVEGLDVEAYAELAATLAQAGEDRDALLSERGLDEDAWQAIEERWQAILSATMDPDDEGVPPLVARYSDAYAAAQRRLSHVDPRAPMSVVRLAEVTRALQRAEDPSKVLAALGVSLAQFLAGNQYWATRMATDAEARAAFLEALAKE